MGHWAMQYLGLPWHPTAEGPDAYYCWSFVRMVQERHFARLLPRIPNPQDLRETLRQVERWRDRLVVPVRRDQAVDGDCVLTRRSRSPWHVGVWLSANGGGVLHCAEGCGVVYQRPEALEINGHYIEGIYRYVDDVAPRGGLEAQPLCTGS